MFSSELTDEASLLNIERILVGFCTDLARGFRLELDKLFYGLTVELKSIKIRSNFNAGRWISIKVYREGLVLTSSAESILDSWIEIPSNLTFSNVWDQSNNIW